MSPSRHHPLSGSALLDLTTYSALNFLLSALAVQFLVTLQTSWLLGLFSVSYTWSPFSIIYPSIGSQHWSVARLMLVYGIGYVAWFGVGLALLRVWTASWRINLFLTWTAFILVNLLPLQMVAGAFVYFGFGVAYTWLLPNFYLRLALALVAVAVMVWFRPFWISRFLLSAYSRVFLSEQAYSKRYILHGLILPWYIGLMMLLPFGISGGSWSWILCLAGLGLLTLPLFNREIPFEYVAYQGEKRIYPFPGARMGLALLWILLFLVSWVKIGE